MIQLSDLIQLIRLLNVSMLREIKGFRIRGRGRSDGFEIRIITWEICVLIEIQFFCAGRDALRERDEWPKYILTRRSVFSFTSFDKSLRLNRIYYPCVERNNGILSRPRLFRAGINFEV